MIIVGCINYYIDPLWCFSHSNKFNEKQLHFNERQQKTNNIFFNGLDGYEGILFGSSRSTFINQRDFYNMNVFNYAIESMYPFEYQDYLDLAKSSKQEPFKYIIIGADFYNSKTRRIKRFEEPEYYINKTKSNFYRYKMLFSFDVCKRSIRNIKSNIFESPHQYYSRQNIKYRLKASENDRVKSYKSNLRRHTENFTGENYQSNSEYINILKHLKQENPQSQFIIFTSPITADLLVSIIKNGGRIDEFDKWLKDLIEVFGEVNHFMTINTITQNLQNYPDDDHYYPHIAELLANKLSSKDNDNIPSDFGVLINKDNVDEYMDRFKEQLMMYENPLDLN